MIIVETVSMFKMVYAVDTENEDWAKDSVVCLKDREEEIAQEWLGETIVSARKVTRKQAQKLVDNGGATLDQLLIRIDD